MEMGALVLIVVNGMDPDGRHRDLADGAHDQLVHFVFEPVALHPQHDGDQFPAERPQPRLGIRQLRPVQQAEHRGRDAVPEPGLGRHLD